MSILLEALRKSEQRKTLGATPGLHTPEPPVAGPEPGRWQRPLRWSVLVVLLLGAALLLWRWWPLPDTETVESAQPAAERPAEAAARTVDESPAAPVRQPRSPVEGLSHDEPFVKAQRPSAEPKSPPAASAPPPATKAVAETSAPEAESPPSPASAETKPTIAPPRQAERTAAKPAPEQNAEVRNAPISFWQLPENLRTRFPAGKINVLVYADAPADRFVVMQGKRYLEGDALGEGFKVHRIEPGRVVFSHRAYRFFITQ